MLLPGARKFCSNQQISLSNKSASQWDVSTHSVVRSKSTKQQVDPLDYFICCRQTFVFFSAWAGLSRNRLVHIFQKTSIIYAI